jgi:pimeloyl-ACP methyl ester carboxylesterase
VPGIQAQRAVLERWDRGDGAVYPDLSNDTLPVLVVSGSHNRIILTVNAYALAQRLPHKQLILYPDAGQGFLFQYHTLFGQHATLFLERPG